MPEALIRTLVFSCSLGLEPCELLPKVLPGASYFDAAVEEALISFKTPRASFAPSNS